MIFTSYHPSYLLSSPEVAPSSSSGYHRFHIGKTREFAVLWYLYVRQFQGKDEHITIVDQGGDIGIDQFLDHVEEGYDVSDADPSAPPVDPANPVKLHIRQFTDKVGIREGVKRLYHYIYKTCHAHNLDMFFIENDCIVAKDWLSECKGKVDFATNNISAQNHRACDTYINWISARRFHDRDILCPLPEFLDGVKTQYGTYVHANDWDALYDVSSTILNERGAYLQWCYGDVLTFKDEGIMHSVEGDKDRLAFLAANPLDHPYYRAFVEEATKVVTARSTP